MEHNEMKLAPNYSMTETQIDCYVISEIAFLMTKEANQAKRESLKLRLQYFVKAIVDREDKS